MLLQSIKLTDVGKILDLCIAHERNYILTQKNQQGLLLCVGQKPLWHIKLPFLPSLMKASNANLLVCGYRYIKNKKGRVQTRPNIAFLKSNGELQWHKKIFTESKLDGQCLIWDIMTLPNEECIVSVIFELSESYTLEHIRFSNTGEILWKQTLRNLQINPLYFYPQKITPRLFRNGSVLYNVGAYVLENSPSATSVIGIDIDRGTLKGTFKASITNAFYTSAIQAPSGFLAVAWQPYGQTEGESGILLLNKQLKCVGEYRTPISTWSGMSWSDKNLVIAGRCKNDRRFHPAIQKLGSNKLTKTFSEHNLVSHVLLQDSIVTYLHKNEQDDLPIHNLIVRNYETDWIYQPSHVAPLSQPILKRMFSQYSIAYGIADKDVVLLKLS